MPLCLIRSALLLTLCFIYFTQLHAQFNNSSRLLKPLPSVISRNIGEADSLYRLNTSRVSNLLPPTTAQLPAAMFTQPKNAIRPRSDKAGGNGQQANLPGSNRMAATVCYTVSGRNFLRQDSLRMWPGDPAITADGNVLVPGEWADYAPNPTTSGGFCMKTDPDGNVLWARLFDSSARTNGDFINYFKVLELRDGTILLAGHTENRTTVSHDLIITKLDNAGNILWSKTYQSRFWQRGNGSDDFFILHDLREDPSTGDVYFVGSHWLGISTITKLDPANGKILWSNGYPVLDNDRTFGMIVNAGNLLLFQISRDYFYRECIDVTAVNKTTGDTLYGRHFRRIGAINDPVLYGTFEVTKFSNGHYAMSGPTTNNYEYPTYTGTVDLYHAAVVELDENLGFVRGYGLKNRLQSNGYNTRVSLFPDGTGIFTMLSLHSSFTADTYISIFKDRQMYHQRKRIHINEGLPYEPPMLQLSSGAYLNIKLMGDSTKNTVQQQESRIDYYRLHTSDTMSACLGVKDPSASFWDFTYAPFSRGYDSLRRNVFAESRVKTLRSQAFRAAPEPACQTISHCDSLAIGASAATVCPGTAVIITIHKNRECGSLVPLAYDTGWINQVTLLTDTTYRFRFNGTGKGYIRASLLGCTLKQDSVLVEVLPARYSVSLGKDTAICPGNTLTLNAGKGFASYSWQDGSTDSTLLVTAPGRYMVSVVNSCGSVFRDTVEVVARPPATIDIGPDRTKCNLDTLHLSAPSGFISYTWSNNYRLGALNLQTVVADPLVDTAYYLKAEMTPGCFAFDTVRVRVYHSPAIDLGKDKSFCMGDSAMFDAGPGFQAYRWSNGQQAQQVSVRTAGAYSVTGITSEGCRSYDTAQVLSVYTLPVVSLDKGNALCSGDSKVLAAGNFAAYQWSTGATSQSIRIYSIGQYAVTVTDMHGCKKSDTTAITAIYPLPAGFLPPDTAVCSYGTLELEPASSSFTRYQWNTGATSPGIVVSKPGIYWVQVTDDHACMGADTIKVIQKQCMSGFYIPTAFSPNADGKNDVFRPLLFGNVKQYRFTVFDRWGAIAFQTADLQKGWDGKRKGLYQQTGVFVWTCMYQFEGEKQKLEKGTVIIIR